MAGKGPKGKTGKRCKFVRTSQMIAWVVVVRSVSESDIGDYEDPELEKEFSPAGGFPEKEQKWALTAINMTSVEYNLRRVYYVRFSAGSGTASPEIRVVHDVRNRNTCKWEISSFGKPTSKLPDGATADGIKSRLAKLKITQGTGTWKGNEWSCVLATLDRLTDQELALIASVTIRRKPVGSDSESAGIYSQKEHAIYLYDPGMRAYEVMALGTKPDRMLPAPAHSVLHEVAHAIAYRRIRAANSKSESAWGKVKEKGKALMNKWGEEAFRFNEDSWEYKWTDKDVSKSLRADFGAEVKDFEKSLKEAKKLEKKVPRASSVVVNFQKVVKLKKLAVVTPYARKKLNEVQFEGAEEGSEKYRGAIEEFFAESFGLWKWYPEWLQKQRKAIYDFFSANKHLT